jgi:hypothetical protein
MLARAALAVLCLALLRSAMAQNAGAVQGSVINSATRTGIPGVAVKLYTRLGVRYETTTDAGGQFNIHGMKEDDYLSSFDHPDFAPPESSRKLFQPPLHVDGKDPARLNIELIAWAKIRGQVVDAEGKPAVNVAVMLDGPRIGPPVNQSTDADGDFTFNKLLPGSYTILATPKPEPPAKEAADNRVEAVPTFYPSAIERPQASAVIVRAGADAAGNTVQLRRLPVYRVRGVVLDEAGKPAPRTTVSLHTRYAAPGSSGTSILGGSRTWYPAPGSGPVIQSTLTDGEGAFEFSSVHEGDWLLLAESEWGYIEETERDIQGVASQILSVSRKDVADIKMRLATNFELPLKVDLEDAPGTSGAGRILLMLWPVNGGPAVAGLPGKDGNLVIDRAYPGQYRVFAQTVRPGFYISSIDYAGRDVSAQPVDIEPGGRPLHFVLRNHAGLVRGQIEKGQAAMVLLFSASDTESDVVHGVECAAGALFQFDNLHPGTYAIAAFDRIDDARLSDRNFLARLLTVARSIRVEEGSNPSIELPVNRWPD